MVAQWVHNPEGGKRPCIDRSPEHLLSLSLIPAWMHKLIPEEMRPGPPSRRQISAIKQSLNMRADQAFNRCRGKNRAFVKRCEDKGDFSHSKKKHSCEECRCRQKAGSGTKGNFYGLGIETGHLGVGLCHRCQLQIPRVLPGVILTNVRIEVEAMRRYGSVSEDTEYAAKVARQERALAETTTKARDEMVIVVKELSRFQKMLEQVDPNEKPTEMTRNGPAPMCDKTRIQLILDIAKTISRLNLDEAKLDPSKFIPADKVILASGEIQQAVREALERVHELTLAQSVRGEDIGTDDPVVDHSWKLFVDRWASIWGRLKSDIGKTS